MSSSSHPLHLFLTFFPPSPSPPPLSQNYLPYLLLHFAVAGGYLAFFFLLSHNFEGVHHIVDGKLVPADDPLGKPQVNTLLRHQVWKRGRRHGSPTAAIEQGPRELRSSFFSLAQVLTSSNVGSSLLAFFNGGLNYQVSARGSSRERACLLALRSLCRHYCIRRANSHALCTPAPLSPPPAPVFLD